MKKIFILLYVAFILYGCNNKLQVTSIQPSTVKLDQSAPEDTAIKSLIAPYKNVLDNEMNEVLIVSTAEATKGQPESSLGNLIADITLNESNKIMLSKKMPKADICMLNNGGLRTSLPEGNITLGKIFELMPFENEIVVLTLSGSKTKGLFKYIARANGMPLSGATLVIADEKPEQIIINGEPFDSTKTYRVATSDYLANGGDKMNFFSKPLDVSITHVKLRDAIVDYMRNENKNGKTLNPKKDGRTRNK